MEKPNPYRPLFVRGEREEEAWEEILSSIIGWIAAISMFIGGWIYAVAAYGWFLGGALGWIPSLILGTFLYFIVFYLVYGVQRIIELLK